MPLSAQPSPHHGQRQDACDLRLLRLRLWLRPPLPRSRPCDGRRASARAGWSLVFGGGNVGLMGEVARAAQEGGAAGAGHHPGFPAIAGAAGDRGRKADRHASICRSAKTLMLQMSDAFLVLPGGLGTFDEFFEVMIEAQLGVHRNPSWWSMWRAITTRSTPCCRAIVEARFAKPTVLESLSSGRRARYRAEDPRGPFSWLT